jgi:hypothetical protein
LCAYLVLGVHFAYHDSNLESNLEPGPCCLWPNSDHEWTNYTIALQLLLCSAALHAWYLLKVWLWISPEPCTQYSNSYHSQLFM